MASGTNASGDGMQLVLSKLYYLPCIMSFIALFGTLATYVIAVYLGDVEPWLPYISDAGGDNPQSTLFSLCNVVASFGIVVGGALYAFIALSKSRSMVVRWLTVLMLLSGVASACGIIILAVNPVNHLSKNQTWYKPVLLPHMRGAVLAFTSGVGSMFLMTACTFALSYPRWTTKVFFMRCALLFVALTSMILHIKFRQRNLSEKDKPVPGHPRHYPPETRVAVISEWVLVMAFLAFGLTAVSEFRRYKLRLVLEDNEKKRDASPSQAPQGPPQGGFRVTLRRRKPQF